MKKGKWQLKKQSGCIRVMEIQTTHLYRIHFFDVKMCVSVCMCT